MLLLEDKLYTSVLRILHNGDLSVVKPFIKITLRDIGYIAIRSGYSDPGEALLFEAVENVLIIAGDLFRDNRIVGCNL